MNGTTRISFWDSVYSESRSLLGRLRNTRLKAMPMLQHCGWGMYLAKLMKEMRDLGFLRHVAYPTCLVFFLKAFNESWIENLEDFLQRRDSLPRRFRLEWALEPLCCCLSVTCPGTFGGTFPGKVWEECKLWMFDIFNIVSGNYMGVSKNRDTPKWMVCNGKPY